MCGQGTSTVCSIVSEVARVIVAELWGQEVAKLMPHTKKEFIVRMQEMHNLWQFSFSLVAIDGCHIPIKCPPGGMAICKEYYNYKNFYSIVLMGMVDSRYRFMRGSCGFPGNSHDGIILQSIDLWKTLNEGYILEMNIEVSCFVRWGTYSCRLSHSISIVAYKTLYKCPTYP